MNVCKLVDGWTVVGVGVNVGGTIGVEEGCIVGITGVGTGVGLGGVSGVEVGTGVNVGGVIGGTRLSIVEALELPDPPQANETKNRTIKSRQ